VAVGRMPRVRRARRRQGRTWTERHRSRAGADRAQEPFAAEPPFVVACHRSSPLPRATVAGRLRRYAARIAGEI